MSFIANPRFKKFGWSGILQMFEAGPVLLSLEAIQTGWINVSNGPLKVQGVIESDVPGQLVVEFSHNKADIFTTYEINIAGGEGQKTWQQSIQAAWVRFTYINDSTPTSGFLCDIFASSQPEVADLFKAGADEKDPYVDFATASNQLNGNQKSEIVTRNAVISAHNPLPTDGDSVYEKDVKDSLTDIGTFTGDILTLFNNLDDEIADTSAENPKYFKFFLERPVRVGAFAIVSKTGNFSNVKITFMDRQGTLIVTEDDSANNTKYTSHSYDIISPTTGRSAFNVCCIMVEFYTTDPVKVSFLYIRKILSVYSHVAGIRDDGIRAEVTLSNTNRLRVVSQPYGNAVAEGDLTGHFGFGAIGERGNVGTTATGEDVWSGTATTLPIPSPTGEQMTVVSSSASDAPGQVGAQTAEIHYIDADGLEQMYDITLNGITPVVLPITNIKYVNDFYVTSAGTNGVAVGTIIIYRSTDATRIYRSIQPGSNVALGSDLMVPIGHYFFLTDWYCSVTAGKPVFMRLRGTFAEKDAESLTVFHTLDSRVLESNSEGIHFTIPKKAPPLSIIKVTAFATQAGAYVTGSFEGYLEPINGN